MEEVRPRALKELQMEGVHAVVVLLPQLLVGEGREGWR